MQQKATHDELKQLCKEMVDGQKQDIDKMKAIPGIKIEAEGMSMNDMGGQHDMSKMHDMNHMDSDMSKMHKEGMSMHQQMDAASGQKFETMFLKGMSHHHQQAIKMSDGCIQNTKNDALKQLCTEMKSTQQSELDQMKGMLSQWYPQQSQSGKDSKPSAQ